MAKRKKSFLPFDKVGGVVAMGRRMLESSAYEQLSAQAKVLLLLIQIHWRNDRPVAYGVSEAMKKIPCAKLTARNAFKELEAAGFIVMVDESLFCSRQQSKSRTWRLTTMPYHTKPPTNDWEKKSDRSKYAPAETTTGSNMYPVEVAAMPGG
jgi:hypothetical protein